MWPSFIIFGVCKSASTWLHVALQKHPQVYMPIAEIPFFEDRYYREDDFSILQDALSPAPEGAVLGIKRADYFGIPACAPRIARHIPGAKLVAMLRNPIDRALSNYLHVVRRGRVPAIPPEAAFSQYLAGRFEPAYLKQCIFEYGNYAAALVCYRGHFPEQNIMLLTDDELNHSPIETFARACRFVGVATDYTPSLLGVRRNQGIHSTPLIKAANFLSKLRYDYQGDTGWATKKEGMGARMAEYALPALNRISSISRLAGLQAPPTLSHETRERLLEYYLPDIEKLERLTGMDLSYWKE